MEGNENIDKKFRDVFLDFETVPPGKVWDGIKNHLHPAKDHLNFWSWIENLPGSSPRFFRLSVGMTAMAVIIFLALVWFISDDHYSLHGHAYSGELRLCRGTAYLFKVEDKIKPFDSLINIRSADLDNNGYYHFSRVEPGKYLIRVSPLENSEEYKLYFASWYDQHTSPDSAHLIYLIREDLSVDIHLMPKK